MYYGESKTTLTNPVAIVEVLSDSKRDYDQGQKFGFYRSLANLQEYVLVDGEKCAVMVYWRVTAKEWTLQILADQTDVLQFNSIGVEIPLEKI